MDLGTPVRYLKGVGPQKEQVIARLGIRSREDLFRWFPCRHEKRFPVKRISELTFGEKECVAGTVTSRGTVRLGGRLSVFKAVVQDGAPAIGASAGRHSLFAVFYHQPYLAQIFKPKSRVVLYGTVEKKGRRLEMVHPEYEVFADVVPARSAHHGRWMPVYPLTEELSQKSLRQTVYEALLGHSELIPERLEAGLRDRLSLLGARDAYRQIHFLPMN